MKKFTALFLALAMSLSLAVPVGATEVEEPTDAPAVETPEVPETPDTETPEEPGASAGELDGYTVILHTNDVHGAIDNYAVIAAVKESYEAAGAYVLLMDAGDYIQGDPAVNVSQGATAVELMNLAGYDVATLGNHEFDFGYENLKAILADADFSVVSANVLYEEEFAFQDSVIFEVDEDTSIGVFGLTTPETATKSHPAKIQGVTFPAGQDMFDMAQAEVDALKAEGCDYIICLGHLGIDAESTGNRSADLLENVTGIDIFIDGHSPTSEAELNDAGYEQVDGTIVTSTGTKLENLGVIEIDPEGAIAVSNEPMADYDLAAMEETSEIYNTVKDRAAEIRAEIEADYGAVFATTEVTLDGVKENVRSMETNLGDLITDAMLWAANDLGEPVDAAVTNGGGIRATVEAGDITKQDINTVLPFGNTLYMVQVTGAELLEALEASTFSTPEPVGGFPQVSGISYTVDTSKAFDSAENYPGSTYGKPASINRVTIESVGDAEFSLEETYTIVTNDFLGAGGDTYYAFAASPIGYDLGVPLDEVVMDYIEVVLEGNVSAEDYGEPAGRITITDGEEEPVEPPAEPEAPAFTDVPADAYYADAVAWAVENGITAGTSATTFSPDNACTRGQMVTFLWRAAGEPTPTTTATENPFTDVIEGQYYFNAVLWAVENGITNGLDATTFGPNATVNRGQTVTFLYRAAGEPFAAGENPFTDVVADSYYYDAVLWAVANEVTTGMSETSFAPNASCTRGQIVTFLYRADSVGLVGLEDVDMVWANDMSLLTGEDTAVTTFAGEIAPSNLLVTDDIFGDVFFNTFYQYETFQATLDLEAFTECEDEHAYEMGLVQIDENGEEQELGYWVISNTDAPVTIEADVSNAHMLKIYMGGGDDCAAPILYDITLSQLPPTVYDEDVVYELEEDESLYVANCIFNGDVTVTGAFCAVTFVNCVFNGDILNTGDMGCIVDVSEATVNGTCYITNDLQEATLEDPFPKFVTLSPLTVVCEDCLGSVIVGADVDITFNGEVYNFSSVDTYITYDSEGIYLNPYEEGMDVDMFSIGQWWENGELKFLIMGESTDPEAMG